MIITCGTFFWLKASLRVSNAAAQRRTCEREQRLETGSKAHTKNLKQTILFNQ